MSRDTKIREESRRNSAEKIISALKDGKDVAMITLGDVSVYSTCTYVHNAVKNAGFELEIIPGITSFLCRCGQGTDKSLRGKRIGCDYSLA